MRDALKDEGGRRKDESGEEVHPSSLSLPYKRPQLILLWIARLTAPVVIVPLMLIAFGEFGRGPAGVREWIYLVLFPFGFSAGYLIGWRWPLPGGLISLICLATSLIVIGRTFAPGPYLIWSALAIPGVLYVIAGLWLRSNAAQRPI